MSNARSASSRQCVIYDDCKDSNGTTPSFPCFSNSEPVNVDASFADSLDSTCGVRIFDYSSGVCCSPSQVDYLKSSFGLAKTFFSSCPACIRNLCRLWLEFACSPFQSRFLNVTIAVPAFPDSEQFVVKQVDYFLSPDYANALYSSCKDVKYLALNTPAMVIAGGDAKSAAEFLSFMGAPITLIKSLEVRFPLSPLVAQEENYISYKTSKNIENLTSLGISFTKNFVPALANAGFTCSSPEDPSLKCECFHCEESCKDSLFPISLPYPGPGNGNYSSNLESFDRTVAWLKDKNEFCRVNTPWNCAGLVATISVFIYLLICALLSLYAFLWSKRLVGNSLVSQRFRRISSLFSDEHRITVDINFGSSSSALNNSFEESDEDDRSDDSMSLLSVSDTASLIVGTPHSHRRAKIRASETIAKNRSPLDNDENQTTFLSAPNTPSAAATSYFSNRSSINTDAAFSIDEETIPESMVPLIMAMVDPTADFQTPTQKISSSTSLRHRSSTSFIPADELTPLACDLENPSPEFSPRLMLSPSTGDSTDASPDLGSIIDRNENESSINDENDNNNHSDSEQSEKNDLYDDRKPLLSLQKSTNQQTEPRGIMSSGRSTRENNQSNYIVIGNTPSRGIAFSPHSNVIPPPPPPPYQSNQSFMYRTHYKLAWLSTTHPRKVLVGFLLLLFITCVFSFFLGGIKVVTNPVMLWAPVGSPSVEAKGVFDENFGPFYRIQQIFLTSKNAETQNNYTLTQNELKEAITWLLKAEDAIRNLSVNVTSVNSNSAPNILNFNLSSLCYAPFEGSGCVVQSVGGYWQNNVDRFLADENWALKFSKCLKVPSKLECLPLFGQPLSSIFVVDNEISTRSFFITIVNRNKKSQNDADFVEAAKSWENLLRELLDEAASAGRLNSTSFSSTLSTSIAVYDFPPVPKNFRLSYSTESSIEQEIMKSTSADFITIIGSYVAMFFYILWHLRSTWLATMCLSIVILSTLLAINTAQIFGFGTSFIILEVMPFFLLAVGVDNEFIMIDEVSRVRYPQSRRDHISKAVAQAAAPGCLLCLVSEVLIFVVTAFVVDVPVVRSFAVCAALGLIYLFVLQFGVFPGLLWQANRIRKASINTRAWSCQIEVLNRNRKKMAVAFLVLVGLCGAAVYSVLDMPALGLDQRDAIPHDSYLRDFFDDQERYYGPGPPIYYMLEGVDLGNADHVGSMCIEHLGCKKTSVPNVLNQMRKYNSSSYILTPATAWVDDFFKWMGPSDNNMPAPPLPRYESTVSYSHAKNLQPHSCCLVKSGSAYTENPEFCNLEAKTLSNNDCVPCMALNHWETKNITLYLEVLSNSGILPFIDEWRRRSPLSGCILDVAGGYADVLPPSNTPANNTVVGFRTYSPALRSQAQLIASYNAQTGPVLKTVQEGLNYALNSTSGETSLRASTYAPHHVFFAQYACLTLRLPFLMIGAVLVAGLCAAVFLRKRHRLAHQDSQRFGAMQMQSPTSIQLSTQRNFFGSTFSAIGWREAINMTLLMGAYVLVLFVQVYGVWRTPVNAISVSNVAMACGLGVEFTGHLVRAYASAAASSVGESLTATAAAAAKVQASTGALVLHGVGLTKVVGTIVLIFARSRLFQKLYLSVYLSAVIAGLTVSLIVAPGYFLMHQQWRTPSSRARLSREPRQF